MTLMRRIVCGLLAWLLCLPVQAQLLLGVQKTAGPPPVFMATPILSLAPSNNAISAAATNYASMMTGNQAFAPTWNNTATIAGRGTPISVAGKIGNLKVYVSTALTQGSYTIGLYKISGGNLTLTTLVCGATNVIDSTHFYCSDDDAAHAVTVAPGDFIGYGDVPSGTPTAATFIFVSALFTSTVGQESPVFWGVKGANMGTAALNFASLGNPRAGTAAEVTVGSVMPTEGTLDTLFVQQSANTSASAQYNYWLYKNGAVTALGCSVAAAASSCNTANGVNAIHVVSGDTVSVEICPSAASPLSAECPTGTAPTAMSTSGSLRWVPDAQNEALLFQQSYTMPTTNSTRFFNLNGAGLTADTIDSWDYAIAPTGMTIKRLWQTQDVTPGGATFRTIGLRGGLFAQAASPGTSGTSATQAVTCTQRSSAFTGTISGTTLTFPSVTSGTVQIGQLVAGAGVSANTVITAGSGLSWTVNNSQTVGPVAMTGADVLQLGTGVWTPGCKDLTHTYSAAVLELLDWTTVPNGTNAALAWTKASAVVTIP